MPLFGQFPIYKEHSQARCFNCGHPLDGRVITDDLPLGRGKHNQKCNACDLRTYYDIKEA